jgi:hypothetical protein
LARKISAIWVISWRVFSLAVTLARTSSLSIAWSGGRSKTF